MERFYQELYSDAKRSKYRVHKRKESVKKFLRKRTCSQKKTQNEVYSFIHSIAMCRMRRFLAVHSSFFHSSLLRTFSCCPSPPTILPSSLTTFCHLFLGLTLNLVVPKFIYNTFWGEFCFLPFSVHAQTNVIYLTLLSLLLWVF